MRFSVYTVAAMLVVLNIFPFAHCGVEVMRLSLAEKIALAKQLADEAAEGKAEAGRVVSGDFDFAKAVEKFRRADTSLESATDVEISRQTSGGKAKSEAGESAGISGATSRAAADEDDGELKKTEPSTLPVKKEKAEIQKIEQTQRSFSSHETEQNLNKRIPAESENKSPAKLDSDSRELKRQTTEISPSASRTENAETPEPKFAVDTKGKDFINGFFVGRLENDDAQTEGMSGQESAPNEILQVGAPDKRFFNYSSSLFFVVSDNYDALSVVIPFVRECDALFNSRFAPRDGKLSLTHKITLNLVGDEKFEMNGHFSVKTDGTDLTLLVKWDESLSLDGFCRLLAGASLRKIYMEERGADGAVEPPYWLETAFACALKQRVSFGVTWSLARIAAFNPPKDLRSVLVFSRDSKIPEADLFAQSFWTFTALEKASPDREVLRRTLYALPMAKSPEDFIKYLSQNFPYLLEGDFDTRWNCVVMGEIWSRISGIYSPAMTEEELLRLAVLQVDTMDGGRTGIADAEGIWSRRESNAKDIELRIVEIKIALPRANPLYHNSLVSLGAAFEAALEDDRELFDEMFSTFMLEFSKAKKTSELVEKQMSI